MIVRQSCDHDTSPMACRIKVLLADPQRRSVSYNLIMQDYTYPADIFFTHEKGTRDGQDL